MTKMIKAITMDCSKERPPSHTQTNDKGVENLPFLEFPPIYKDLENRNFRRGKFYR